MKKVLLAEFRLYLQRKSLIQKSISRTVRIGQENSLYFFIEMNLNIRTVEKINGEFCINENIGADAEEL
jgi:hypothetical protein